MGVGIKVVHRQRAALVDSHKLGLKVIVLRGDMVRRPRWQVTDGALDPDDAIHRHGEMRHSLLGGHPGVSLIPGSHSGVIVVIKPRLLESERHMLTRCDLQREGRQIQEVALIWRGCERMRNSIIVLPGHSGVWFDRQNKRLKQVLALWNGHCRQWSGLAHRRMRDGRTGMGSEDGGPEYDANHDTNYQVNDE